MNRLLIKVMDKIGFVPKSDLVLVEAQPNEISDIFNFKKITDSCSRNQLNALVYEAMRKASIDPEKRDLLKRWSVRAKNLSEPTKKK